MLAQLAGVTESAVLALLNESIGPCLVAYVVANPKPPAMDFLRSHLARRLPQHMVPSAFVLLDALPRTPNGKIDRIALAGNKYELQVSSEVQYVAPQNSIEISLVAIWEELLGHQPIGIHANFFEIGGHSLLATQVLNRVRQLFGIDIVLGAFLENPTVYGLSARVSAASVAYQAKVEQVMDLVDEVSALSDEEVLARLSEV